MGHAVSQGIILQHSQKCVPQKVKVNLSLTGCDYTAFLKISPSQGIIIRIRKAKLAKFDIKNEYCI